MSRREEASKLNSENMSLYQTKWFGTSQVNRAYQLQNKDFAAESKIFDTAR